MSEWGGYLKRAVATMESHLDQVILESSNGPQKSPIDKSPTPPAPIVETTEKNHDDFTTVDTFGDTPEIQQVLQALEELVLQLDDPARKIESKIKDHALDCVDMLANTKEKVDTYSDSVNSRIQALVSKLRYLSNETLSKFDEGTKEKQIARLLDEGARLTERELKLGIRVKKLVGEKAGLEKKLSSTTKDLDELRNQHKELEKQYKDFESQQHQTRLDVADTKVVSLGRELETALSDIQVLNSRYDSLVESSAEHASKLQGEIDALHTNLAEANARVEHYRSMAETTTAQVATDKQIKDLQRRLDAAASSRAAAQEAWKDREEEMLAKLATSDANANHLRENLETLSLRSRELQTSLQEQRDARFVLLQQLEDLNTQLAQNKRDSTKQIVGLESEIERIAPLESKVAQLETANAQLQEELSSRPYSPPEPEQSMEMLPDLVDLDEEGLLFRPPPLESRPSSSRLDPEAQSINASTGGGSVVVKLGKLVQKLESELEMCKQSMAVQLEERDKAHQELMVYMASDDRAAKSTEENAVLKKQLADSQSTTEKLLVKLGEREERVSELEADVCDLKESYRIQIETLLK